MDCGQKEPFTWKTDLVRFSTVPKSIYRYQTVSDSQLRPLRVLSPDVLIRWPVNDRRRLMALELRKLKNKAKMSQRMRPKKNCRRSSRKICNERSNFFISLTFCANFCIFFFEIIFLKILAWIEVSLWIIYIFIKKSFKGESRVCASGNYDKLVSFVDVEFFFGWLKFAVVIRKFALVELS